MFPFFDFLWNNYMEKTVPPRMECKTIFPFLEEDLRIGLQDITSQSIKS